MRARNWRLPRPRVSRSPSYAYPERPASNNRAFYCHILRYIRGRTAQMTQFQDTASGLKRSV
jgi:hypothetical protein